MHPNPSFRWTDGDEIADFIRDVSFAHLFVEGPEGPLVAHTPLLVISNERLQFHLANGNPVTRHLDGRRVLASIAGADAYISPDWYGTPDQVPTWNYVAAEARGTVRRLNAEELVSCTDGLSAEHEERLLPKRPWTREKMTAGRFERMLGSITGFEMRVESLVGTRKFGQNKSEAERRGAIAGLQGQGQIAAATMMSAALSGGAAR